MKKLLSLALALALFASLAACGGNGGSSAPQSTEAGTEQQTAAPGTDSGEAEPANEDLSAQEAVTLNLYTITFKSDPGENLPSVEAALNEYLTEKLNTTVKMNVLPYASYLQQANLMMSGSDQVDLLMAAGSLASNFAAAGGLAPLDDALAAYGQGILEVMGDDVLNTGRFDGTLYTIPTNRDLARSYGFMYSQEINQQYGLGLENAKGWDDVGAALARLQQQAPEIIGLYGEGNSSIFNGGWDWDALGSYAFGVLLNSGEELTVENLYASEQYSEMVNRMREWYLAGYINKDATTTSAPANELMLAGKVLGYLVNYNPASSYFSPRYPVEMGFVELVDPFMSTSTVQTASWVVGRNTVDVNRSMQVLNLMYTDPYVVNLLTYGLEGQDYVFADEGAGIIDYPEGVSAETARYDNSIGWMWGNQFLGYIWNGDSPTAWQDLDTFNKTAKISRATGFTFDPTNVQNEITACTNVREKYANGLECGAVDPAEVLPQFLAELEANGINDIIAEKQAQLDAWAAAG